MATQVAIATDQLWDHWPYLSHEQRLKQFRELHTGEKADFFLALDAHDQYNLLLGLPEDQRHVWMRLLAPDDAADVIQQADPEERERLLALLDEPTRKEVVALLAYKEDDAGGLMNPRFARLRPDTTVDVAISYLRKEAPSVAQMYYAYVLDQAQRLLGVVSLRQLFIGRSGETRAGVHDDERSGLRDAGDGREGGFKDCARQPAASRARARGRSSHGGHCDRG